MARRTPAQYDWDKALFNDRRLSKHFTSPRRSRIRTVTLHHMTILAPGDGSSSTVALEGCYRTWQTRQASANYGVSGNQVWQYVSDNDAAWANASSSNHETLSIEHANSTAGPSWKVSNKTMETGARLVASLHRLYGLGRPSRKTVKMHRDYYATACPGPFMVDHLGEYIARAARFYDGAKDEPTTPPAPKPPARPKTEPRQWFRLRGDNLGGFNDHGAKTWDDRLPDVVADIDKTKPAVQALLEVPNGKRTEVAKALADIDLDMVTKEMTNGRHLAIREGVERYGHGKLALAGGIPGDPKHGAWVACSPDGKKSNAVIVVTAQLQHVQTAAGAAARKREFASLMAQVDALRTPKTGVLKGRWSIPWTRVVLYVDTNDYDGILADEAARLGFFDAHDVAYQPLNPTLKTYRPFGTDVTKGPTTDMVLVYKTRTVRQSGTRVLNPQVLDHLTRWVDLGYSA